VPDSRTGATAAPSPQLVTGLGKTRIQPLPLPRRCIGNPVFEFACVMPQPAAMFPAGRGLRIDNPDNCRFGFGNDRMRASCSRKNHQSERKKGGRQAGIYHDFTVGTIGVAQERTGLPRYSGAHDRYRAQGGSRAKTR